MPRFMDQTQQTPGVFTVKSDLNSGFNPRIFSGFEKGRGPENRPNSEKWPKNQICLILKRKKPEFAKPARSNEIAPSTTMVQENGISETTRACRVASSSHEYQKQTRIHPRVSESLHGTHILLIIATSLEDPADTTPLCSF
ncbi:unnamed protein product, partial [Heterotrigona itama]